MGLFGRGKGGGLMNVIRCDETEYLVWKWRPRGQAADTTSRENAIRYGSSLRVKDSEVAVFVYKQETGVVQDFIEGPYDGVISTANLPVLANIVGLAFGGEIPLQAEVYFINLQGNNQIRFAVPYFGVVDPRLPDYPVPIAVRGVITFALVDYRRFIKLYRLRDLSLEEFTLQIKRTVERKVKGVVANLPSELGVPLVQLERHIDDISDVVEEQLQERLDEFGVEVKHIDISAVDIDKTSEAYAEVKALTGDITAYTMATQASVNVQNMLDMQKLNQKNLSETMRIQREEAQRAQRLQTESSYMGAHALDQQTSVLQTAAESLGQMGGMSASGTGMNPAEMMTGMMMGGALGSQMSGMMNQMGQQVQNAINTPPPMPNTQEVQYLLATNGQQMGPFTIQQLQLMAQAGVLTLQSYLWRPGLTQWVQAGTLPDLSGSFASESSSSEIGDCPPPPPKS